MTGCTAGISTASLFGRMYNEDSVAFLSANGIPEAEVFLGTYSEYTVPFAQLVKKRAGGMNIHSVHTLNTHFEPQLFSSNPRALDDAYAILANVLAAAGVLGAKYYTFHGVARVKRSVSYTDYKAIGEKMNALTQKCAESGVVLALENVEWAYYNHVGFYSGVKQFCPLLKGTLDVKQAREAGEGYLPYLEEMGEDIVTVHLSDVDENGKLCLPGRGKFPFGQLFERLADKGFSGALLIEVYKENYSDTAELLQSYNYINELKEKFGL